MTSGAVIWICGLSGSGKTTFANALVDRLRGQFNSVVLLDGDVLREIYNDFNYTKEGRLNCVYRSQKLCAMLAKSGCIVVVAFATMQKEIFLSNRKTFEKYFEILIDCPFEELVKRDQKGLYSRALRGEIKDVYGVDIPCDFPNADFVLDNSKCNALESKVDILHERIMEFLFSLTIPQSLSLKTKVAHTPVLIQEAYAIMQEFRPYLTLNDFISKVLHLDKTAQFCLLLFYDNERLIGLCGFMPSNLLYEKKCLFISDFVVSSDVRGRGYGEKMFSIIESIAYANGFEEIALESGILRERAHKFYIEKCGFNQARFGFKKILGR
ncbi:adenylyl-sulfate kinase [Helicobacter turcicus]|uniref:Adenylyl-sulfate kinase n=1 Tax=Helicobacter turcicus TaxID=2867412 RepID=A0ABS7JPZ8_9HELI|nr:adenylyl-sulfate kinase [Helicobacter turcicus]MBX7491486.1 adenylyl-sulfate kinase [Helicobacter turcicus]MBX7546342.1 adenylyl-sulfate kinase [Helicobacter turcicus]